MVLSNCVEREKYRRYVFEKHKVIKLFPCEKFPKYKIEEISIYK